MTVEAVAARYRRSAGRSRLWLGVGAVAVLLVLIVGWLLLIGPERAKAANFANQTMTAQDQRLAALHGLSQLRAQNANLAKYQAELAAQQAALPPDSAIAAFLREVQNAGTAAGVTVTGVSVGTPQLVTANGQPASAGGAAPAANAGGSQGAIYSLTIALTASGSSDALMAFIQQLQAVQPRAVLIDSVTQTAGTGGAAATSTVSLRAFVAPALAATPSR